MSIGERCFNVLLGLTFISMGLKKLYESPQLPPTVVLGSYALLVWVGLMCFTRRPARRHGSLLDIAIATPSLIVGGAIVMMASEDWSLLAQSLFVIGTSIAILSFYWLGDSFSVLPSVRKIKTMGPYRLVRHPPYLGELILVSAGCLSSVNLLRIGVLLVCVLLVVARILVEEKLLANEKSYREYSQKVCWRLVPGVW